jgi:predicted nucleic acid-binding protein
MIFADTGYFIGLIDPNDGLHRRALAWSHRVNEPILVTEYVAWETMNHFAKRSRRSRAGELIRRVMGDRAGYEFVPATPDLFDLGLQMYERTRDQTWSLTDCISIGLMTRRRLDRALAFDHHFIQARVQALLRLDP